MSCPLIVKLIVQPVHPHDALYPRDAGIHMKEQNWLDLVFDKYDTNKNEQLEKGELIELLRRVSPDVEMSGCGRGLRARDSRQLC